MKNLPVACHTAGERYNEKDDFEKEADKLPVTQENKPLQQGPETNWLNGKLHQLWQWAKSKPQTAVLGEFFYEVGFWGEYTARRAARGAQELVHGLGKRLAGAVKILGGYVSRAFTTCWQEITEPFRRFHNGIKNIADVMRREREQSKAHAVKEGAAYFGRGVKLYYPLLKNALAYVVPVLALGVFAYTVRTVLGYNYALAVEVDGQVVGYVENEQVFDDAAAEIQQRIKPINGEVTDWKVAPTYSIAISDETLPVNQMADSILKASSSEIVDASALYVNGEIVGVTTEGEELKSYIEGMKAPYEDPDNPNLRVEFTKELAVEDGIYAARSLVSAGDIEAILEGEEQGQLNYTVQQFDTPSGIASSHGLSTQQLVDMNPQQDILKMLHIGDTLIIQKSMPFLEIRRIETRTEQETIPYKNVTQNSSDLGFGQTRIKQKGEEGLHEVVREYVYYGDSETPSETTEIQRTVLKEPVDEIKEIGQKLANGDLAQVGNGVLAWPVPNYKGVSRWMTNGHKGADIRANFGTPIYASDSGVVTTAGWHYSYGNHVVINHGNGTTTLYAHASRLAVRPGQSVQRGDVIAYVGSTGNSTGNHCHFEIRINGQRIDPHRYFPHK